MLDHTKAARGGEGSSPAPHSLDQPDSQPVNPPGGSWVDRVPIAELRPYLRLGRFDHPIGAWLLLLPAWWGVALGAEAGAMPDASLLVLFLVGAFAMRAAGCSFNDIVDKDFDAQVERTRHRPLASGQINNLQAVLWISILVGVGLNVVMLLNFIAFQLSVASLFLVLIYPFMKRFTNLPQAFLGITFNFGILIGFASATGELRNETWALYVGAILWTIAYDTIYAHQDKDDDALIGVKSTALLFGDHSRVWVGIFYGVASAAFVMAGLIAELGISYYVAVAATAALLGWQTLTVDFDNPSDCLAKFRSNQWVGFIMFLGISAGHLL
jgi:4-hydroxybenzoate polyprenyltransferase